MFVSCRCLGAMICGLIEDTSFKACCKLRSNSKNVSACAEIAGKRLRGVETDGASRVASHFIHLRDCSCCQPRYVTDVKLGLPVPDGFWACLLPDKSASPSFFASEDRRLLSQDSRPESRSRPVRVFGVCAGSREARQSFVWEVR